MEPPRRLRRYCKTQDLNRETRSVESRPSQELTSAALEAEPPVAFSWPKPLRAVRSGRTPARPPTPAPEAAAEVGAASSTGNATKRRRILGRRPAAPCVEDAQPPTSANTRKAKARRHSTGSASKENEEKIQPSDMELLKNAAIQFLLQQGCHVVDLRSGERTQASEGTTDRHAVAIAPAEGITVGTANGIGATGRDVASVAALDSVSVGASDAVGPTNGDANAATSSDRSLNRVGDAIDAIPSVSAALVEPAKIECPPISAEEIAKPINDADYVFNVNMADPPVAYGEAWKVEGKPEDAHLPSFTASKLTRQCGFPLPKANSRQRCLASAAFADQLARREDLGCGKKEPTMKALVLGRAGDEDVTACAMSADGRYCAAASKLVNLWDVGHSLDRDGQPSRRIEKSRSVKDSTKLVGHSGLVTAVKFSPESEWLLSAGSDGTSRLWSVRDRKLLSMYAYQHDPIWALEWNTIGHYFFTGIKDGTSLVWSVERSCPVRALVPPDSLDRLGCGSYKTVDAIKSHPSVRYVATATEDYVALWDLNSAGPARCFPAAKNTSVISCSPDGELLGIGCWDGSLEVYDVGKAQRLWRSEAAHTGIVTALDFSWPTAQAADAVLFSAGTDGAAKFWSMPSSGGGIVLDAPFATKYMLGHRGASAILHGHLTLGNVAMVTAMDS